MTYRILVLDTAAQTHNSYIALAIVDALRRHPAVERVRQADYGNAVDLFRREGCDTVLALGGAGADLAVLGRLCAMAVRSVLWTTEDPYELEENLRVAAPFDLVFTNDLGCLPAYGARGQHLPLAGSRLFHDHPPVLDDAFFLYDLCFVGTAWPNRVDTINRILDGVKRPLRMKIGLPTNPHLPPVVLGDPGLATNWRVPNPELARIANRSRITLSLERKFSSARTDQASGSTPPPRLFENALAGAFQVALGGRAEAMRYFGEDEIAFCDNEDELLARITWALDHPEARIAMAQAARSRALAEHLYDHRIAALVAGLAEIPASVAARVPTGSRRARKRVLLVTHNVQGHQPGGGVEVYQQELAAGAGEFDVLTLYPRVIDGTAAYTLIAHRTGEQHLYGVPEPAGPGTLHDAGHERVFEQILIENDIDLVHFQHLLGMPLSLPLIARACGVPSLYTLHDFYLVCSQFNLLDHRGRYCDIAARSPTECDICLSASGIPAGAQQRRRNFVARVIEAFDGLIANSPFTAQYLRAIYPEVPAERIRVVEMLTPASHRLPPARQPASDIALTVAIPGNFTRPKGADTILRVLTHLRDEAIAFHILGEIPDQDLARQVRAMDLPRVTLRGGYAAHELPRLMAGMDVSLHLSVWPETYMISLNEARAAGAVPVISDLGAPAERVRAGLDGFKVAPEDAGHVCDILRDLARDRDRLETMRAASKACRIVSPAEHVAAISDLYRETIARSPVHPPAVTIRPERDYILNLRACGIRTNTPSWIESGNGWDADPPRPARQARTTLWRTFPVQFAHLDRPAAGSARVRVGMDGVQADRRPAAWPRIVVRSGLSLWGWGFAEGRGRPLDVILHLKGDAQEIYAVSPPVPRGDVRAHLDEPDAEASGFSFDLDLDTLREGTYAIRLMQVYDGAVIDLGAAGEAVVRRGQGQDAAAPSGGQPTAQSPAQTLAEAFRGGAAPAPDARTVEGDAAVTRYETALDPGHGPGSQDAAFGVQGWALNRARRQVFPMVAVGLVPAGGTAAWFRAERCRAPSGSVEADPVYAFAGFRAAMAIATLAPGLHRIIIAESDRRETVLHETGEAVLVKAEAGDTRRLVTPCREVRLDPTAGREVQPRREPPAHRLSLDEVETGLGAAEGGAGSHLYLRGWAWVPGRGRADGLTLVLAGAEVSLRAVLPAARREDVVAHLGEPEAEWAGFEALVPTAALPPGRYEAEIQYGRGPDRIGLPLALTLDRTLALAA
ncbi:glycosyltransferase [Methylobacterium terricola]|uniref:Glycosyltransferase n=1 Tax=Methylobacterium terricola TaxID=2583531 RepID=A0A5C4LH91_9HYPH|nr:glycosyltransferase [Methylobacterium terricola]TNC12758.1 glycosyltransferase [Methylobacterium terricola]